MTLMPADIIVVVTLPGVGMQAPRFLKRGDGRRLGIGSLGEQEQMVVALGRER